MNRIPGFPVSVPYGMAERRRSRNMAAAGMLGLMTLTILGGLALQAERILTPPAMQMRPAAVVHARFRTMPERKMEQPERKKILTEASDFRISEEPEPEKVMPPEPEPEVRPKAVPERKVTPKPAARSGPAVKKPVKKVSRPPAAAPEAAESSDTGGSGGVASMPGISEREKAEKDGRSAALAAVLQAVEKHKRYPRQGRRSGAEGLCTLMVQIGADGRVVACSLAGSSGRAVLDAASKRLGEKLVGLQVGDRGGFRILVPVHYRLTDR